MNSWASTEAATGAEARGVRRWLGRAIFARLWIHFLIGVLIVLSVLLYGRWVKADVPTGVRECRPGLDQQVQVNVDACLSEDEDIFDKLR